MRHTIKRGLLTAAFAAAVGVTGAATATLAINTAPGIAAVAAYGLAVWFGSTHFWKLLPVHMPKGTRAPLSSDEITLLKNVFGRKLATADLKKVRKYFKPTIQKKVRKGLISKLMGVFDRQPNTLALAAVFNRRAVEFYGANQHERDYSAAKSPQNFGVFVHEMTHIWQHTSLTQTFIETFRKTRKYDYKLTDRSRFTFFGVEQQASIMQDYALRFLYPHGDVPANGIMTTPENDALLIKVVERKFPAARKARLALADKKRAQATPEGRKKFLKMLGKETIETFKKWEREAGSTFRIKTHVSPYTLEIETNLPGKIGVSFDRDGSFDVYEGLDYKEEGVVSNMEPLFAELRRQAEEAGLLKKKSPAPAAKPKSAAL